MISKTTSRLLNKRSKEHTANSPDSTANLSDATVYAFLANQPNGSQLVHEDLEQIHEDDLEEMDLKWQLALLSMRARRYFQRTGKKITINGSDTAGYDKSKVECFNCHKMGHFARECRGPRNQDNRNRNQDSSRRTVNVEETSSKAMVAIDGAGFDWSFMADEEVPTNMALMAFSDSEVYNDKTCTNTCLKSFETLKTQYDNLRIEFNKSEFNLATYKRGLASVEEQLVFYKKNEVMFCDQIVVLKRDTSFKDSEINALKSEIEKLKKEKESNQIKIDKFKNASKSLDKLIRSQISDNIKRVSNITPEFKGYGPKASKTVCKDTSNEVKKTPDAPLGKKLVSKKEKQTIFPTKIESVKQQEKPVRKPVKLTGITIKGKRWNMTPRAVLMKTSLKPLNIARHVNTAYPKTIEKVYTAKPKAVNTAKPKAVNTARSTSEVVNAVRANQVNAIKASACWVWRPTKLNNASITFKRQNYIDARGKSKFTWVFFLASKDETSGILKNFLTEIENLVDKKVKIIRCDNGTEFKNRVTNEFCEKKGIKREFSVARTPQQNGVAERRNRILIEAARTMVIIVKPHTNTPYELFSGRTPTLSFMRIFRCHVTILNTLDHLGKFDGKSYDGFFVGYFIDSTNSNDFADGSMFDSSSKNSSDDKSQPSSNAEKKDDEGKWIWQHFTTSYQVPTTTNTRIPKDHSLDHVIGDIQSGVQTRGMTKNTNEHGFISAVFEGETHEDLNTCLFACFLSQEEPKRIAKALINTAKPKAVNTARSTSEVVNAVRANQFHPQKEDQGYVDSGCSRHMTGNMSYLTDFKEFDRGYVTFRGGARGGRIAGKGTLKTDVRTASTPMDTKNPLLKDSDGDDVDVHLYKSMIGSVLYLTSSRPDIMFAVCACARFQVTPKVSHSHAVKRIFKYLKGQPKLGLWYPRNSPFDLVAYSNSDYAGVSLDRKSTTGDIYTTRIVMKNPNPLNKPNEAIPEVNPVVPEPNQVVDIHDPNEMVDIPDDVDLVDYDGDDEENSKEDPEEEPEPNNGLVNQFAPHVDPHQPGVMIGWLEENDGVNEGVNNEDIEDKDVEIELDDDAD
ncbi:ribonuclease H-like domain-containing protein [Tanacetum coccineum]